MSSWDNRSRKQRRCVSAATPRRPVISERLAHQSMRIPQCQLATLAALDQELFDALGRLKGHQAGNGAELNDAVDVCQLSGPAPHAQRPSHVVVSLMRCPHARRSSPSLGSSHLLHQARERHVLDGPNVALILRHGLHVRRDGRELLEPPPSLPQITTYTDRLRGLASDPHRTPPTYRRW